MKILAVLLQAIEYTSLLTSWHSLIPQVSFKENEPWYCGSE